MNCSVRRREALSKCVVPDLANVFGAIVATSPVAVPVVIVDGETGETPGVVGETTAGGIDTLDDSS